MCNSIPCRPKSVPVQHSSGKLPVAEKQRSRSVPRFHQHTVVFVKRFQISGNRIFVVEALRHKHGQGMGKAFAGHHEKLQHVIQRCAVAHGRLNNGEQVLYIPQDAGFQNTFPAFHPLPVAPDGIDLTVVSKHAEGLRQVPGRESIGAETGVDQGHPACKVRI